MEDKPSCRICYGESEEKNMLISPCNCKGSVKYIHERCLRYWRCHGKQFKQISTCEQCKSEYIVHNDRQINKIIVHIATTITLLTSYLCSNILLKLFYYSYSALIDDIVDVKGSLTSEIYHTSCILIFSIIF